MNSSKISHEISASVMELHISVTVTVAVPGLNPVLCEKLLKVSSGAVSHEYVYGPNPDVGVTSN